MTLNDLLIEFLSGKLRNFSFVRCVYFLRANRNTNRAIIFGVTFVFAFLYIYLRVVVVVVVVASTSIRNNLTLTTTTTQHNNNVTNREDEKTHWNKGE